MSKPTYLYKIIPSSNPPPNPLPEKLPLSALDSSSGFIHLSTAVQIPGTLKHFFADESLVYILRVNYDALEKDLKWEDPDAKGKPGLLRIKREALFKVKIPDSLWRKRR